MDYRDKLCPGNCFFFGVHKHGIEMSKVIHYLKQSQKELTQFAIDNLLGRVFYCEGEAAYYVCLYGANQRCDGLPVTRYELKDLSAQVRANKELSPAYLHADDEDEDDDGGSQGKGAKNTKSAGPHWIRWIVTQEFYKKYMKMRIGDRVLAGISMSPLYNTDNLAYLVAYAPNEYAVMRTLKDETDYKDYINHVNSLMIPGTDIPAVRWVLSHLFWVKFDGDISSFITFLVMLVSATHPCGWAPGKMFILSGDMGSGKSELLTWISTFIAPINMNDNIQIEALSRQFNSSTCKPRIFIHESDKNWYKKLNNGTIRTLISDVNQNKEYEKKFGGQSAVYGSPLITLIADRDGEPASVQERDRRHAHCRISRVPANEADFSKCKHGYTLWSKLFTYVNPAFDGFRAEYRKIFMSFFSIYYPVICPTGVKIPHLFERRDYFDGATDATGSSASSTTLEPAPKRVRTITTNIKTGIDKMAYQLAMKGSIFPVEHPNVFAVLFKQLTMFSDVDTADNKSNLIRRLLQCTWKKDISSYQFQASPESEVKTFDDTLCSLYEQWKVESESIVESADSSAFLDQLTFRRMLAKFKETLLMKAWVNFDPKYEAWPRLLSPSTALWFLGVWINFLTNKNKLNPAVNVWGGQDCVDLEKLSNVSRLIATRLSGRSGYHGPKETVLTAAQISKFLGVNLSSYLGIGRTTLSLKAISLTWGPFPILRQLVQHVSSDYRPSEEELEMLVERSGGDLMIMDQDRVAYDQLLGATKSRLMDQLANFFSEPDAISKVHEEERIYYTIYADLFSGGPLGLMRKAEYFASLDRIEARIEPVQAPIGYRPPMMVFRSPDALGETKLAKREVVANSLPIEDYEGQIEVLVKESEKNMEFVESTAPVPSPLFRFDKEIITHTTYDDEESTYVDLEADTQDGLA